MEEEEKSRKLEDRVLECDSGGSMTSETFLDLLNMPKTRIISANLKEIQKRVVIHLTYEEGKKAGEETDEDTRRYGRHFIHLKYDDIPPLKSYLEKTGGHYAFAQKKFKRIGRCLAGHTSKWPLSIWFRLCTNWENWRDADY
jgi:hypothetical protein